MRRTWIVLAVSWLGVLVVLVLWLQTPVSQLREQLRSLQFWSLEICLALGLGLTIGFFVRRK